MGRGSGYNEMNEKQKRAVLGALLSQADEGVLPHGCFAKIGAKLGIPAKSVARLWRAAVSTRAAGQIQSPDVKSKKESNLGIKDSQTVYNREDVMEQIKSIPLDKRSTVRHAAAELKIPKSTVQRIIKEDGEGLCVKANRLKVLLKDDHYIQRIDYCFAQMRWHGATARQGKYFFHDQTDTIHLDEKWFFVSKVSKRFILATDEEEPYRTCQSKTNISKVMFLVAQARPRYLSSGVFWDGKIGCWPLGEKVQQQRTTSVRRRGDWKWKSCGVGAEVYMEMMKEFVVPAIMEKWPLDAGHSVIKLQHDNAPAHFKETVPEWVDYMEHFDSLGMPYKLKLIHQPAQSPDTNILDLGFFAALQSTCLGRPKDEMELIEMVQQQYEAYPAKLINRVWLSHMACMNEILKDNGGNNYKIPHLSKDKLEREGRLPWVLEVNKEAMDRLKGQGFQPPTVDYSIPGSVNGRSIMRVTL